jgi:acetyl esterase/lipase
MTSRRMRLARAILRRVVRPLNAAVQSPALLRAAMGFAAALSPGAGVAVAEGKGGIRWFLPADAPVDAPVILYLHGGAYIAGNPMHYRAMLGRLAAWSGCRVAAPVLRLAPEHPAPAAFDDAVAAHAAVVSGQGEPARVVLGGDSAGGGLALSLLAHLCAQNTRPVGLFAFSPWTDLALTGASLTLNADSDCLLPASRMAEVVALVRGGLPATDPRLSPLGAAFDAPPPCQFWVGSDEVLRDDSRRMADRLRAAGGRVDLSEVPDVFHAWPIGAGRLPEADETLRATADFVRGLFSPSSSSADTRAPRPDAVT